MFFKRQIWTIERLDNQWYLYGATDRDTNSQNNDSISCNDVGTLYFKGDTCLVRIDSSGVFLKAPNDEIYNLDRVNILYSNGLGEVENLNNQRLTWQNRLDMQNGKAKNKQTINRKLFLELGK